MNNNAETSTIWYDWHMESLSRSGFIQFNIYPLLSAASGDVQAYQIRAAPASTIAPGVVMASSPALPTQGATEEVTRKREVRLMKNRYEHLNVGFAVASENF